MQPSLKNTSAKQHSGNCQHFWTVDQFEISQGVKERQGAGTVICQRKSCRRQAAHLQLLSELVDLGFSDVSTFLSFLQLMLDFPEPGHTPVSGAASCHPSWRGSQPHPDGAAGP